MSRGTILTLGSLAIGLTSPAAFAAEPASPLHNGGFETLDDQGKPANWTPQDAAATCLTDDRPRNGQHCGRLLGDAKMQWLRQVVPQPATRIYVGSGWFRADAVEARREDPDRDYLRLYFHILYRDRPYSDTTHLWRDLPLGSYDWTRFAVRLVPRTEWPIAEIWVTVAGKFGAGHLDFDDLELRPGAGGGGAVALDWQHGAEPRVLTDLSLAQPAEALTDHARHGHWQTIDYEAGPYQGKLLWASADTDAPPLTIPLQATGPQAVYLGLTDPASSGCTVLARLSGDPAYVPRRRSAGAIEEVLLKVAELTGRDLQIAQRTGVASQGAGLAYVKLVPLTAQEWAEWTEESAPARRTSVASLDGFSFIYSRRPTTVEDLREEVEVYRDTDFGTLLLQYGGADMTNYPTEVGTVLGSGLDDYPRRGDRNYAEAVQALAAAGINPTKVLLDGAHDAGLKVHIGMRPGGWFGAEPKSDFFRSRFYVDHPEWHCRDRDGEEVARMSFAVPEVRRHLVEVVQEAVRFGADGACVLFVRGVPFVLFEQPFLELFQQRHGEDARQAADDDPRLQALRVELVTDLMRELRTMLDQEAARRGDGQRLALSAMVLADEADNLRYGIDVRAWAAGGLVDLLMPYRGAGGGRAATVDLAFFHDACAPHQVPVKPVLVAWQLRDTEDAASQAAALLDGGADGLTVWDANDAAAANDRWAVVSRLGHVDELRELAESGVPRPVTLRFHRLGGLLMDGPYHPDWGF